MRDLSKCLALVIACLPIVATGTAFAIEEDEYAEYPVPDNAGITSPYVGAVLAIVDDNISVGNIDDAIDRVRLHLAPEMTDAKREGMRRSFSSIYGGAGVYDGHELAAVRVISPRIHDVYVVGHYQEVLVQFRVRMRRFEGEWKIGGFSASTELDELEAFAPVERLSQ